MSRFDDVINITRTRLDQTNQEHIDMIVQTKGLNGLNKKLLEICKI